jgi:hypothetical protein
MERFAYHRTHKDNLENIMANGILSMKSQGFVFPCFKSMEQGEYSHYALALREAGFKFIIPSLDAVARAGAPSFARRDYRVSQHRYSTTFATVGGVDRTWSDEEGVTVKIDLRKLDCDWRDDDYCTMSSAEHDAYDIHILGDIPADAIVGVVSDLEMIQAGLEVKTKWE